MGVGQRELDDETVLGSRTVFHPDPAAVEAHVLGDEREAESRAVRSAALAGRLPPVEPIEHLVAFGRRDSRPVVGDDEPDRAGRRLDGEARGSSCVLSSVLDQVCHDSLDASLVDEESDSDGPRRYVDRHGTCPCRSWPRGG